MNMQSINTAHDLRAAASADAARLTNNTIGGPETAQTDNELQEVFGKFVGETFFHQLIKSMRTSVGKPAYFHGGRAEEVFQGQLDQMLSEQMAENSAEEIARPMYELFQLQRRAG